MLPELKRRLLAHVRSLPVEELVSKLEPGRFNALAQGHEVHLVTAFPLPHMDQRVRNLSNLGFVYQSLNQSTVTPPAK